MESAGGVKAARGQGRNVLRANGAERRRSSSFFYQNMASRASEKILAPMQRGLGNGGHDNMESSFLLFSNPPGVYKPPAAVPGLGCGPSGHTTQRARGEIFRVNLSLARLPSRVSFVRAVLIDLELSDGSRVDSSGNDLHQRRTSTGDPGSSPAVGTVARTRGYPPADHPVSESRRPPRPSPAPMLGHSGWRAP